MSQNRSSAVMQQRAEPHDSLDDFPTPPWAARALCEHVLNGAMLRIRRPSVLEPACNRGYLARGLADYFGEVRCSDIADYGGNAVADFLFPGPIEPVDWVITNPPFRLAEQFINRSLCVGREGVAILVRSAFLEGCGRYETLFNVYPPHFIAQFAERVPMVKGRCDPKASTATAYSWLVWTDYDSGNIDTQFIWIPPCRKKLEREGDYA